MTTPAATACIRLGLAVSPIWQSNAHEQPATPLTHSGSVSHATATQMRLGLLTVLDEGWLAFDTVKVTSRSQPIAVSDNQSFDLEALVDGHLNQAGSGRLFIEYSDGSIEDMWQNPANFSGSQPVSGSFTPPTGASFQVATEVTLDQGWAAFQNVKLTGWSQPISSGGGQAYDFSARVAGNIIALILTSTRSTIRPG